MNLNRGRDADIIACVIVDDVNIGRAMINEGLAKFTVSISVSQRLDWDWCSEKFYIQD